MFDGFLKFPARRVGLPDAPAVEFFVFCLAEFLRHLMRDFPGVGEYVAIIERQEAVEFGDPIAHGHGHSPQGLPFGKNEVLLHQVVEGGEFGFVKVVLGDGHVVLAHFRAALIGQAHLRLGAVGAGVDNFRRRLVGDGPVHFVLHGLEKLNADFLGRAAATPT